MSKQLYMQTKPTSVQKPSFSPAHRGRLQRVSSPNSVLTIPVLGQDFSKVHVHPAMPGMIQTKLTVNRPGDRYEQEADQVAEQVMRMPVTQQGIGASGQSHGIPVQRCCSECEEEVHRQPMEEEEEEEESLQAKKIPGQTPKVTSDLHERINSIRGGGQPLLASTRAFMEPRFGHDFSQVRIHTDVQAAETAQALHAKAYTMGREIVFRAGQYAPGTEEGRRLLAHELTHVVQQTSSRSKPVEISSRHRPHESEAEKFTSSTSRDRATNFGSNLSSPLLQRKEESFKLSEPTELKLPSRQQSTLLPSDERPINIGVEGITQSFVKQMLAEEEKPVRQWLEKNTDRLRFLSRDNVINQIKSKVPQAEKLADNRIQSIVLEWAILHDTFAAKAKEEPTRIKEDRTRRRSDLYSRFSKILATALSVPFTGVDIKPSPSTDKPSPPSTAFNISVLGLASELKVGQLGAESKIFFDRTIEFDVSYGDMKFSVELSLKENKWKLSLSYPKDPTPYLNELPKIFSEGEKSLRSIASNPENFIDKVKEAKENLKNIMEAMFKNIAIIVKKEGSTGVMLEWTVIRF